jgi:hypothetical protein
MEHEKLTFGIGYGGVEVDWEVEWVSGCKISDIIWIQVRG